MSFLILAACHTPPQSDLAPTQAATEQEPAAEERPEEPQVHAIKGTIQRIELQNINKAQGYYTYNTHLYIEVASYEPAHVRPAIPLKVRLNYKPKWRQMKESERAALSPDGPKQTLEPLSFREYRVGQAVALDIRFTSTDLAHLVK